MLIYQRVYHFGYVHDFHVAEYSGEAWTFGQQRLIWRGVCEVFANQRGVFLSRLSQPAGSNGMQQKSFFSSMNPWKSHFYPIIYRGLSSKSCFFFFCMKVMGMTRWSLVVPLINNRIVSFEWSNPSNSTMEFFWRHGRRTFSNIRCILEHVGTIAGWWWLEPTGILNDSPETVGN